MDSGLTQKQAAEKAETTDVSISSWENGANISEPMLGKLEKVYGKPRSYLRYGIEREDSDEVSYFQSAVPAVVREAPRVALGIPQAIRVWLQEFLLDLVKAGVSDDEVDRVRRILSSDEMFRFYVGGEPENYSEAQTLQGIQAHALAFRAELRERGYDVP